MSDMVLVFLSKRTTLKFSLFLWTNRLNFDQRGFEKGMASIDEFENYHTKIIF